MKNGKSSTVPFYLAVILSISLLMPPGVMAQAIIEAITNKLNTEDAIPVGLGKTQVEFGYTYTGADQAYDANNDLVDIRGNRKHEVELKVYYGFTENLDASAEIGYANLRNFDNDPQRGDGFGDLSLNMKWRFFANKKYRLHLAYLPGITMPIGDATDDTRLGPSQDYWGFDQRFVITAGGRRFNGSLDIGYSLPLGEERKNERGALTVNTALGYHYTFWFQPEVEINFGHDFRKTEEDSEFMAVTIGAIVIFPPRIRLDLGVQQVVYGQSTDQETVAKMNLSVTF